VLLCAAREDGCDASGAEFGGLLDAPLEMIELEDGKQEMDWECGVGFELFVKLEDNLAVGDSEHFGPVQKAVRNYIKYLSGLCAKDASEVCGLVAGERCGGVGEGVCDETTARHES